MSVFPSLEEKSYEELENRLFDAVARGDVRAMLNDEIVPKAHIAVYLRLYARATTDQEPHTLPPNLALNTTI